MSRLDMLSNLRNIQAKMAEAHFLIIEEIKRLGTDGADGGSRPQCTEDLSEMVEWCQDSEAPSRWRAPGTKDIGQKVRCSLWLGVRPEDMREGVLVDIRKGDRAENEYLVSHKGQQYQQWWRVALIEAAEQTTADVLHIELVPPPVVLDAARVILEDGEVFLADSINSEEPEYITPGPEHVGQMVEVSDDEATWYPRKLLAVMALGCGFIVHALGEEAGVGMKKLHARVEA